MDYIIEKLLKQKILSPEQVDEALALCVTTRKTLFEQIIDMGLVTEDELEGISGDNTEKDSLDLSQHLPNAYCMELIPYEKANKYGIVPISFEDNILTVAMSNPADLIVIDDLQILTNKQIKAVHAEEDDIYNCIERVYRYIASTNDMFKNIIEHSVVEVLDDSSRTVKLDIVDAMDKNAPVVRLVNLVLSDAVKSRASDVHIEPHEDHIHVRYRIDGHLRNIMTVPIELKNNLIARLKIITGQDIAETRKAQDGRARVSISDQVVDLRVSTIPTFYGEKVVMRLLGAQHYFNKLEGLGIANSQLAALKAELAEPQGMILVTGPTGSGKTSTLYAALNYIKNESKNIVTIEDPIEYVIDGINQIEINRVKDVTFATGLKSILRQDPNVILVGEIRDLETAEIAFRASLTGHLVLSTLHTNSSISTIVRLIDLGLEPYLISSSLNLIVSQRLVRLVCPYCKESYTPEENLLERYGKYLKGHGVESYYQGNGCEKCDFSGYLGRTAVFEVCEFDDTFRSMIAKNKSAEDLFIYARQKGLKTLTEAAIEKVVAGIVTLEEVSRNIPTDDFGVKVLSEKFNEPEIEEPEVKRERPLILVVDDEDAIRRLLELRLKHLGYDVLIASDGKQGIELVARMSPDLIIMDVMMPIMNGIDAVKYLRSQLKTGTIPIIMLTAKSELQDEINGFDAGADDYISKPFDMDRLKVRIEALLRRSR